MKTYCVWLRGDRLYPSTPIEKEPNPPTPYVNVILLFEVLKPILKTF